MNKMKMFGAVFLLAISSLQATQAKTYKIDDAHSFVEFKTLHLGFSWLNGRFNQIAGQFKFDPAKLNESTVEATVDMSSLDSNHGKRDDHLRSDEFLDVKKFSQATFKSSKFQFDGKKGSLEGLLNFHGVEKPITFAVEAVGEGKDPWGGYRRGFTAKGNFSQTDFGVKLGANLDKSNLVQLEIFIEGVEQ